MKTLPLSLALTLGLSVGFITSSSCGTSRVCTPTTCNGCCDLSGTCQQLPTATACGSRGETCKACSLGQLCSLGVCTGGLGSGGFGAAGGSATAGGGSAGGGAAGGAFAGGLAGGFAGGASGGGGGGGPQSCGPTTCSDGCCNGSTCVRFGNNAQDATCGQLGQACVNCTLISSICNGSTYTCTGGTAGGAAGGFGGGGPSVSGDDCASVISLGPITGTPQTTSGTITGYNNSTSACSGSGPDAVYAVTLLSTSALSVGVSASGFTPRVSIRSTCATATPLACDAPSTSSFATASLPSLSPGTYYVWVDSSSVSASGTFSLAVSNTGAGGGGFGGGFGGGSSGTGTYVASTIVANCDSMVGSTTLLSSATTPALTDDSTSLIQALPITFQFFGGLVTTYSAQSNGMAQLYPSFSGTPSTNWTNTFIPNSGIPNGFVAPLWDDLGPTTGSAVRTRLNLSGANPAFIISWLAMQGAGTEFQVKLFANSDVIEFHYCTMIAGSPSIGVEDLTGTLGVSRPSTSAVTGSGIRFTPSP